MSDRVAKQGLTVALMMAIGAGALAAQSRLIGTVRDTTGAQTARPVTIQGLEASDVLVRIMGDVAIIHARTSYTTAGGESRQGRYTDVWARRGAQWLAVSAHVTR